MLKDPGGPQQPISTKSFRVATYRHTDKQTHTHTNCSSFSLLDDAVVNFIMYIHYMYPEN